VLIGATGTDPTLLDIIRYADGWMPIEGTEPIHERWQRLRQLASEHGRNPEELSLHVYASSGDPSELDAHRAAGATEVIIAVTGTHDHVRRQLDHHARALAS
jgi:alkanesulfonate monooxygenase SsuD/methylene tetrahydromethanopterin reductase-like flavin-dependent oxidoreductase (luciferase family)